MKKVIEPIKLATELSELFLKRTFRGTLYSKKGKDIVYTERAQNQFNKIYDETLRIIIEKSNSYNNIKNFFSLNLDDIIFLKKIQNQGYIEFKSTQRIDYLSAKKLTDKNLLELDEHAWYPTFLLTDMGKKLLTYEQ